VRVGYGYGIARYVMGRRRRCADTLAVVRVYQSSRSTARPDGTSDLIWGSLVRRTLLGLCYKIPGIDFKAGAGMFSVVAFIELIPRKLLKGIVVENHEPRML
jgi:hypothetical protein